MNVLATFSGRAYEETTGLIVGRGTAMGADRVMVFDDRWLIESGFQSLNPWLWEPAPGANGEMKGVPYAHGFGWCSWKAFVVLSAMDRLHDGDVVMYVDADTFPIAHFGMLFEACRREGGVYLFNEPGCSTLRFTKADCFLAMGMPIAEAVHGCGRFSLWQKGPLLPRQMLAEWWAYSINPRCTRWDSSILQPDQPEYYRNSTEQSVLTNLATKYKIPLHRNPDQCGADPNHGGDWDLYGQLFEQKFCTGDHGDLSGSSFRNV